MEYSLASWSGKRITAMTNGIKRMDVAQFMREYQEKKENRKKQDHTDSSFPQILEQEMKKESSSPTKAE